MEFFVALCYALAALGAGVFASFFNEGFGVVASVSIIGFAVIYFLQKNGKKK